MEGVVVSAATGVLSSLLSKLALLLSDQYKQLKDVRRDIESLSRELTDMNAALVKLADREKLDVQTKVWRDKVREMAYDIEDIIDIFMHHHEQGDDKDGLFCKAVCKIRKLRVRHQIVSMIQDIKARVKEQSKSRDRYKVEESNSNPRVVEVDPRLPALFADAKRLVGIDGPREEIIKLLMEEADDSHNAQLKVVSIVGFGGLGKTTLAKQVYNKIENKFERAAFVSVSRTPHMPKILKDILASFGYCGNEMEDDVQKHIEILRAWLTNKRYLIIIDDLWNTNDWLIIKCIFVENNNGSRVLTTTRRQDIAKTCCFPVQGHMYQMQPLDESDSKRLFCKRLFDGKDGCPEQFYDISNEMLRKCKGVPLAITSIASLLANQTMHVETWEKIRNSLGSELDTNPTLEWMTHVLSLSYNDLSYELKSCLLYLGTYPEDYRIPKFNLIRKWIAEGFVREKHGLDTEEAAENCFNELINRSMIQACFHDSGELWGCQVHDLMLDLIISKCKEENFISIIDRKLTMNRASQVRRISHQFNYRDMALAIKTLSLSQVRSYNSFSAIDCMPPLSKFQLLRVLDMDQDSLPGAQPMCLDLSATNHLFLLRYLRVSGFCLKLPKKFGKLKHLMTLDILWASLYPSNQISDFTSLSSLRDLSLPADGESIALTNGLSKLRNLRTLFRFDIGANSVECIRDLGELTNLRALTVFYGKPAGDVEGNSDTILAASLDKLVNSNLRCLNFKVGSGANRAPSTQFWTNCFTCPLHLQRLILDGLIPMVPDWMAHADRMTYLYGLEVQELKSDGIRVLAQLPCLIYLWLKAKTIPEKNIIIHQKAFPSLKHFEFICELSWMTFEPAAMQRLQRLEIQLDGRGEKAMQLPEGSPVIGVEHLASLEEISVYILAKGNHGSKIESAWRDTISRHPKNQAIKSHVNFEEWSWGIPR